MSASISKRKNNSWKDPEIEKIVEGYISRGSSKNSEFYTSAEVSDKLVEMGLPRIEPRELGAFLTADKYIRKHFFIPRYPDGNPDGRDVDHSHRRINKWRVIFNNPPVKKEQEEASIKTVVIPHYADEYDWDAPPREPLPEGMWRTKEGSLIEISKMTNDHLKNSINYCKRVEWPEMEKVLIKERERRKAAQKKKAHSVPDDSSGPCKIEIKMYCQGYADGYVDAMMKIIEKGNAMDYLKKIIENGGPEDMAFYKKLIMLDVHKRLQK